MTALATASLAVMAWIIARIAVASGSRGKSGPSRCAAAPATGLLTGFSRAVIALPRRQPGPQLAGAGRHLFCGLHSAFRAGSAGLVP